MPEAASRTRGALRPIELAMAAVMSAMALAIVLLSVVIRHAGAIGLIAVIPYGILAHRHRIRAVVAGAVSGALLAFLLLGVGATIDLLEYAVVGSVIGDIKRRGRGVGTLATVSVVMGLAAAAVADLVLLAFAGYRRLVLDTVRATVKGLTRSLDHISWLRPLAHELDRVSGSLITHWPWTVAIAVIIAVPVTLVGSWVVFGTVLDRLQWVRADDPLLHIAAVTGPPEAPKPLPLELRAVSLRYPSADGDALRKIDLSIGEGEFVVIVGDNGSGKSTLARVLAGVEPTSGAVHRPGPVGLGQIGGTALIMQRPDAQVLGVRVADDVLWGLPEDHQVDVPKLLTSVGLGGLQDLETATLSGGQLQRLSIAAAIARRPRLLVSDESTAMIDPEGRVELIQLLASLPRQHSMSVVHVTHSEQESATADRVVRLSAGQLVDETSDSSTAQAAAAAFRATPAVRASPAVQASPARASERSEPVFVMDGLGHTYRSGSPWAHTALHGIDLRIHAGEGIVIVGDNGSGKSTLAWIMAGLLRPSVGACLLQGKPAHQQVGEVGLAFQHARLQVQRPCVGADIADAAGWPHTSQPSARQRADIAQALHRVGLAPELATRSIDELSGGQLRRVAIAGLLARGSRVLVLDEPLAGLDAPSRIELLDVLARLRFELGVTVVVVSHDVRDLGAVLPREIRLSAGSITADTKTGTAPIAYGAVG